MSKRLHIIIAEPSSIIRSGLVAMLQRSTTLSCDVAQVSDLGSLNTKIIRTTPDLLIVNISLLGRTSPTQLRDELGYEQLKVIGVQGVLWDTSLLQGYDELVTLYDSEDSILDKVTRVATSSDDLAGRRELSGREREIIICVVKGMTNRAIADSLNLSTHTVIAHRRNIASKLQIHSPSGLTIYAIVNKLVDLSEVKNSI